MGNFQYLNTQALEKLAQSCTFILSRMKSLPLCKANTDLWWGRRRIYLKRGQTIFLPRGIPHTWIQLMDTGRMVYFLQPAGNMEAFFTLMNSLKERPLNKEMERVHAAHDMKEVGPPLTI